MVAFSFLLQDASAGTTVAELHPTGDTEVSPLLSDVGSCTVSLNRQDPTADDAEDLAQLDLTVLADGECIHNGPVTGARENLDADTFDITSHELPWVFSRGTVEVNRNYNTNLFSITRDLVSQYLVKTNGSLYRFSVTGGAGGGTKAWKFSGYGRRNILTTIADLAADAFDFRMAYSTSGELVTRQMELGAPTLGVVRGNVLEAAAGLLSLGVERDLHRAANRVHVIGGNGLVHTSTNATSYAAGDRVIEEVINRSDINASAVIVAAAQDAARKMKPPVTVISATVGWTAALPFGFCQVGDTVTINEPEMGVVDTDKRVIGMTHRLASGTTELLFADPI